MAAGNSYTVTPGSARYRGSAISALDAARVAQCVVGVRPMTDCPANTANVSNSGGVSAFDAALIARYAVGLTSPASQVGAWVYSPAARTYTNVPASQVNQNYQAFIRGDVTGNWGPGSLASADAVTDVAAAGAPDAVSGAARLLVPAARDGNDQLVTALGLGGPPPVAAVAYQFELHYDPALLQLAAIDSGGTLSSGWDVVWNEAAPGHVLVAAYGSQPLAGAGILLHLVFNTGADPAAALAGLTVAPIVLDEGAAQIGVVTDYWPQLTDRLYLPAVQVAAE